MAKRKSLFGPTEELEDLLPDEDAVAPEHCENPFVDFNLISIGCWEYERADPLVGPKVDLELVNELFSNEGPLGIVPAQNIQSLENPTNAQFRKMIAEFATSRSSKGDVLILYFSGHGTRVGSDFAFCCVDTRKVWDREEPLAVTVVTSRDVLRTLLAADVKPIVIIDACYAGQAGTDSEVGAESTIDKLDENLRQFAATDYAFICATSGEAEAADGRDGSLFTTLLLEAAKEGVSDGEDQRRPTMSICKLFTSVSQKCMLMGHPLSKLRFGPTFNQDLAICMNVAFEPQIESFAPYYVPLLRHLWNDGCPIEIHRSETRRSSFSPGVYSNYSKMMNYQPWRLLEFGSTNDHYRLSERGIRFMTGGLKVAKRLHRVPNSKEYITDKKSNEVGIEDF